MTRHTRVAVGEGDCGDQQVVGTDRSAAVGEFGANACGMLRGGVIERERWEVGDEQFDLFQLGVRTCAAAPSEQKFGSYNAAH